MTLEIKLTSTFASYIFSLLTMLSMQTTHSGAISSCDSSNGGALASSKAGGAEGFIFKLSVIW